MSQGRRRSPLPPDWRERRSAVLARDPICQLRTHCDGAPSTEVDHHRHHTDHRLESLQGVCSVCHQFKTSSDAARIRNQAPVKRAEGRHPGLRA